MFLDLDEFCRALLSRRPFVALVTWANPAALRSFVVRLGPALRAERSDTVMANLVGADLDSAGFQAKLTASMARRDAQKRCLLVYQIEPLVSAAGEILNGYRERLGRFRAVVVAIRENRKRDFLRVCPDLMDWVGTNVVRVEDLAPALTVQKVNALIKEYEHRFAMTSDRFQEMWNRGEVESQGDQWFWNELIAIRSSIKRAEGK